VSQQINLFNPALRPKRELFSSVNVAIAAAITLVAVAVVGSVASGLAAQRRSEAQAADAALKSAQGRLTQLAQTAAAAKPDAKLKTELETARSLVKTRDEVLAALHRGSVGGGTAGYAEVLRSLARQSLSGLWLTGIRGDPATGDLELRGRTLDAALVADYVRRLNAERMLAGHSFAALSMDRPNLADKSAAPASAPRPAPYLEFVLGAEASKAEPVADPGAKS